MSLSAATLQSALAALEPEAAEASAAQNFADAYAIHAAQAMALTAITAPGVALGKAAMVSALSGLSASGAAAGLIKAALAAFWAAVAGGLAVSFAGATAITPPSFSALSLQPVFDAATSGSQTQAQAVAALASAITAASTGGTVTTAGPTVTPIS